MSHIPNYMEVLTHAAHLKKQQSLGTRSILGCMYQRLGPWGFPTSLTPFSEMENDPWQGAMCKWTPEDWSGSREYRNIIILTASIWTALILRLTDADESTDASPDAQLTIRHRWQWLQRYGKVWLINAKTIVNGTDCLKRKSSRKQADFRAISFQNSFQNQCFISHALLGKKGASSSEKLYLWLRPR